MYGVCMGGGLIPSHHFAVQSWCPSLWVGRRARKQKNSAYKKCHFSTEYPEATANNRQLVIG